MILSGDEVTQDYGSVVKPMQCRTRALRNGLLDVRLVFWENVFRENDDLVVVTEVEDIRCYSHANGVALTQISLHTDSHDCSSLSLSQHSSLGREALPAVKPDALTVQHLVLHDCKRQPGVFLGATETARKGSVLR